MKTPKNSEKKLGKVPTKKTEKLATKPAAIKPKKRFDDDDDDDFEYNDLEELDNFNDYDDDDEDY